MPHAVGDVDRNHHADGLFSLHVLSCLVVENGAKESERDQGNDQASQEKQEEILQAYLTGTNHQGSPQQFHGRPVSAASMALMKQVNDNGNGYAGRGQSSPAADPSNWRKLS